MSFATETAKMTSARWVLMRLKPTFLIHMPSNPDWGTTTVAADTYQQVFSDKRPIVEVRQNGTLLTRVDSSPGYSQWSYDDSTGTLQFKVSVQENITCKYYLFFSSEVSGTRWNQDPDDSTSAIKFWQPRIETVPEIKESIRDNMAGVFQVQDSVISLANQDNYLNDYLTFHDSFNHADVDIWLCVNSNSNRQLLFNGLVRNLRITPDSAVLDIYDAFAKLQQDAFMGDTYFEAVLTTDSTDGHPDMDPKKNGYPCRYHTAARSRSRTKIGGVWPVLDSDGTYQATCIDSSTPFIGTENRIWAICRIHGNLETRSFTSISSVSSISTGYFEAVLDGGATYELGDTIKWTLSGNTYVGTIAYIASGVGVWNVKVISAVNVASHVPVSTGSHISTSAVCVATKGLGLCYEFDPADPDGTAWLRQTYDFTITEAATSGGNNFVKITLVNSFESTNYSYWGAIASSGKFASFERKFIYRVSNDDPDSCEGLIERICGFVGLTTNDSQIEDLLNGERLAMSIPEFGQVEYKSHLYYLQLVLESLYAFMRRNVSTGEIEVGLVGSGIGVFDDFDALTVDNCRHLATEVISSDIYNQFSIRIEEADGVFSRMLAPQGASVGGQIKEESINLHGIQRKYKQSSVASWGTDNTGLISARIVIYTLELPQFGLGFSVGDVLRLQTDYILPSAETTGPTADDFVQCVLISISRSPNRVEIEVRTLEELN